MATETTKTKKTWLWIAGSVIVLTIGGWIYNKYVESQIPMPAYESGYKGRSYDITTAEANEPNRITYANYEAIHTGMTWDQVVKVLGDRAKEMQRSEFEGNVMAVFNWKGEGMANIIITFQNGEVSAKGQVGL